MSALKTPVVPAPHLKSVETKDIGSIIFDMESTVCDAFQLANALHLAIIGAEGAAMEEDDKRDALQTLAYMVKRCNGEVRKGMEGAR